MSAHEDEARKVAMDLLLSAEHIPIGRTEDELAAYLPILLAFAERVREPLLYTSDKQTVAWKQRAEAAEAESVLWRERALVAESEAAALRAQLSEAQAESERRFDRYVAAEAEVSRLRERVEELIEKLNGAIESAIMHRTRNAQTTERLSEARQRFERLREHLKVRHACQNFDDFEDPDYGF